jgi:organic hydroperoxide reductase OsmC/OhrA
MNPEQLVVMAASSCQLLSFLAVAARAGVDVVGYEDDAVGVMPADVSPQRITRIELRPRITVTAQAGPDPAGVVAPLVHQAHDECYVANSLTAEVRVDPTVVVGG